MKLAISTWSYHRALEAKKLDLTQVIKLIAGLGAQGIELIDDHLESTDVDTLGLEISALSIGNNYNQPEVIKEGIKKAVLLKTKILRIFAGWPPEGKKDELWDTMINTIKECVPQAEAANIIMAIEPHNHGGFIATKAEARRALQEVGSNQVKLNLDTGNYLDQDIYLAIKETLPDSVHVHYKIHDHEPVLDYPRIFNLIKDSSYNDFISLEYEGEGDELENVPKYFQMLKELL